MCHDDICVCVYACVCACGQDLTPAPLEPFIARGADVVLVKGMYDPVDCVSGALHFSHYF